MFLLVAMHSNAARRPRRGRIVAAVIVVFGATALYLALTAKPSVTTAKLPDPNGYDDFMKASQSIVPWTGDALQSPARLTVVQLNSNALAFVRAGLTHECAVPLANRDDRFQSQQLSSRLAGF